MTGLVAPEPPESSKTRLRTAGLRPTSQRCAIADLLFRGRERHVDANMLFDELSVVGKQVSLATVYNTLKDFENAGLIRRIAVSGDRVWYDTDTGDHRHFYIAEEDRILDCPKPGKEASHVVDAPPGYRVKRIDVVVHLEAELRTERSLPRRRTASLKVG